MIFPSKSSDNAVAFRSLLGLCIVAGLASGPSHSEERVSAIDIEVGAIYSSNVTLTSSDRDIDDTVYRIAPRFSLGKESGRFSGLLNYMPEALFYENFGSANEVYHVLDAQAQFNAMDNRFKIDIGGQRFQVIDGADSAFPSNNFAISERRTDATVWTVTPAWQEAFGDVRMSASSTFRKSNFDDPPSLNRRDSIDSEEISSSLRFDNHAIKQGVTWAAAYNHKRFNFEGDVLPWEYQQAFIELGYRLSDKLRIFGAGGRETPFNAFLDPQMKDDFWEAGLDFTPNQRLSLQVAAGERSYGSSYRGRVTYQMRRGMTEFEYTEAPATQNEILANRQPFEQTDNLDDFLTRLGEDQQFVRKRAEWRTVVDLPKSTITLRLFDEQRDDAFSFEGAIRPEESYRGAAARFDWNLSNRMILALAYDRAERQGGLSEEDFARHSVEGTYQLSRRLSLVARFQRSTEDGLQEGNGGGYSENQFQLFARIGVMP